MKEDGFVLKGNICYSKSRTELSFTENGYLVCEDGCSAGVFQELPEKYNNLQLQDCGSRLIIPGLVDLHIHAPQYTFRGMGMDMELLEWLDVHTFPEEARYADLDYAKRAYGIFAENMKKSGTTRACVFATVHPAATELLMDQLDAAGLAAMVGKVNMDRNAPENLVEKDAAASIQATREWLTSVSGKYERIKPILTPRFTPSCTDELMELLGELQRETGLPAQSHLSENMGEVQWVKELCPATAFYGEAYDRYGLFGGSCSTIMAHCVQSGEDEIALMKARGVYIAHCPQSNTNIASGIAPVRKYLDADLRVGLGSDVAGGTTESIFRAMVDAIQVSKLRWRLVDESEKPLTVEEAFYLGTLGGGAFFGKVGSFAPGYEFDALVLNDETLASPRPFTLMERLERILYLSDDRHIEEKYVAGRKIYAVAAERQTGGM